MKKIIPIILLILIITVGITSYLNREYVKDKETMVENHFFAIKDDGKEVGIVNLELIESLEVQEFKANLKSSGKEMVEHIYKGVPLNQILASQEQSLENRKQVVIRSVDGYTVVLSIEEILEEDNVYIVYKRDGEDLGKKEDGGSGPYQVVIRKDPFGQRWAKFVVEVELQ